MIKEYGYEYEVQCDPELWNKSNGKVTHDTFLGAMCLRSGRDALKVVAREFDKATVLLPALSCASMRIPFLLYGHNIEYYRLNKDYSIDLKDLDDKIRNSSERVLFLYMDYFGKEAISDSHLFRIKENNQNVVFIEDRTHILLLNKARKFEPEYAVASLRKWIDIPDGGLLWLKGELRNGTFSDNLDFSITRLKAQNMRYEFLKSGDLELKQRFRTIFSSVSDQIDKELEPARMSAYSFEKANRYDLKMISDKRKENAECLICELKNIGFHFVQPKTGVSDIYVSLMVEKRDELQKALAEKGIFCTIIWPLSDKQKKCCEVAKCTEKHMLSIYCDQRYTVDDMKYIASQIVRLSNEKKINDFGC